MFDVGQSSVSVQNKKKRKQETERVSTVEEVNKNEVAIVCVMYLKTDLSLSILGI